jgi:hypothetical protein
VDVDPEVEQQWGRRVERQAHREDARVDPGARIVGADLPPPELALDADDVGRNALLAEGPLPRAWR